MRGLREARAGDEEMIKCKICGKISKFVAVDDNICSHWDRAITEEELEIIKNSSCLEALNEKTNP
jgi:hypothetical protein